MIDDPEKLPAKHTKKMPAPKLVTLTPLTRGNSPVAYRCYGDGAKFDPAVGVTDLCKVGLK